MESRTVSTLRRDTIIYFLVAGTFLYVAMVSFFIGHDVTISWQRFFQQILAVEILTLFALAIAYPIKLFRNGHRRPIDAIRQKLADLVAAPSEIIAFLAINVCILIFISCFSFIKAMIPTILPFAFDPLFAEWDRLLHFGYDPWRITHAVFSHPYITAFINFMYNLWFFLFWGVLFFFILRPGGPALRQRYILSFFLCWLIVGGVMATFMSSAGPVFYARVIAGPDYFTDLMTHLRAEDAWLRESGSPVTVWSLNIADLLWDRYVNAESGLGSGISAMPSMHVSLAVLMALGMRAVSRFWGAVFWGYAALIQIGSVHLAWHYAIDGYVSIIATIIIWWLVGRFTAFQEARLTAS